MLFQSNIINGENLLHINSCIFATISNTVFDNITLTSFTIDTVRITGVGGSTTLSNVSITNSDFLSTPSVYLEGSYGQIVMAQITADNLTTDTQGSIIKIDLATILQASYLTFSNINSYTSDSNDNYMIDITAMDLGAQFPTQIQHVTVSNSTTGVLKIGSLSGSLSQNNLLAIQNFVISDCSIQNSIDIISFTSVTTSELYAIVFSNMIFRDLQFTQGASLFNLEHLMTLPIQIIDSEFSNILGGKINLEPFSKDISNLNLNLAINNITVNNVNTQFSSFIEIQTGVILSITNSNFFNVH